MKPEYDVIVAGGGIAGIAAALASARKGARTLLLEKEYALGGLATLGLIVVYLPLDDGQGVQMSAGIAEELLKLSLVDGPGEIPEVWRRPATAEERKGTRYQVTYNAATMMINAEKLLLQEGVTLFYDARITDVAAEGEKITSVTVATKRGPRVFTGGAFVDATGDADILYFGGEPTVDSDDNRRTGWYFGYDGEKVQLHMQTDPILEAIPETSRTYSGTKLEDIAAHMFDMHEMIELHAKKQSELRQKAHYPFMIPAFHGLRMTRRLDGKATFSLEKHSDLWFTDTVGMIGNWRRPQGRYAIPYASICGVNHDNIFAAGRCTSAEGEGWDQTRVIPACSVTGQAAGTAAALTALTGTRPEAAELQAVLKNDGVLLDETLFKGTVNE